MFMVVVGDAGFTSRLGDDVHMDTAVVKCESSALPMNNQPRPPIQWYVIKENCFVLELTQNAQNKCKNCLDYKRSWQICEIITHLFGLPQSKQTDWKIIFLEKNGKAKKRTHIYTAHLRKI